MSKIAPILLRTIVYNSPLNVIGRVLKQQKLVNKQHALFSSVVCDEKFVINHGTGINLPKVDEVKSILEPCEDIDTSDLGKLLVPTFNLAAYVNKSQTLQELVKLGVELHSLEKKREVAQMILSLDLEKDIKPMVQFLHDKGVAADMLGKVLTKNPQLLQEDVDDLQVRINYLESKRFTKNEISIIIMRNPIWLSRTVEEIDSRLGFFQSTYSLLGNEVRQLVNTFPKLITYSLQKITVHNFVFKEEMGFNDKEIKGLLLKYPRLFQDGQRGLLAAFEYLQREMNISLQQIYEQPEILRIRPSKLRERHQFLLSLGRAQYNPLLPGYVSVGDMVKGTDTDFAEQIAKSSVLSFNAFLKSL